MREITNTTFLKPKREPTNVLSCPAPILYIHFSLALRRNFATLFLMKKFNIIFVICSLVGLAQFSHGDDFLKTPRDQRCKNAGGLVAGHGAPTINAETKGSIAGPIDCTCGGKRFNPLREGDACRNGVILPAMERYCQDSKGTLSITKTPGKPWPVETKKCLCGDKDFAPSKTTLCASGQLSQKN
jgi:hypothetical protein